LLPPLFVTANPKPVVRYAGNAKRFGNAILAADANTLFVSS
jgi:hypothetical protein